MTKQFVLLARSKLNRIENIVSKALLENEISHEEVLTIINDAENYHKLKESIRTMKSQRSDIEGNKPIEDSKRIETDEIVKQNERINNNL